MDTDKSSVRARVQAVLRATTVEQRTTWSGDQRRHLVRSETWRTARTVMLFAAMHYEPDLLPLLEPGKRFAFPSLEDDVIVPREVRDSEDLLVSPLGIREPDPARCPVVRDVDLVLVPGLGFGRDGTRLGRGRGHYDRFLAALPENAVRCGVCFDCQLSESLPIEPHDAGMHLVLTESGLISVLWGAPAEVAE